MQKVNTPWENAMGNIPMHLSYFEGSLYDALANTAAKYPKSVAFDFMGKSTRYDTFLKDVRTCANALWQMGIRPGDRVTIAIIRSAALKAYSLSAPFSHNVEGL